MDIKSNKDIKLKLIDKNDIQGLFDLYSDEKVCKHFDISPYKRINESEKQIEKWIENYTKRSQIRYSIRINGEFVGTCGIYSIYWHQCRASLGYDLKSKYWGMGIMTQVVDLLLIKIKELNIHRIQATVRPKNIASKKLLLRNGFNLEGILKDYEKWKGEYVDLEMYSKILL